VPALLRSVRKRAGRAEVRGSGVSETGCTISATGLEGYEDKHGPIFDRTS
jgi:hypothetical protein